MENNELYHFGIQGMKWGKRRYQNEDGSLTDEGRARYGYKVRSSGKGLIQTIKTKRQAKVELKKKEKQKKERIKRLEAARKAKAEKKAHEDAKNKALESGDAREILKYKNELTTQQKNEAYNRLQSDANLARLADDENRRASEEAARNSKWNKAMKIASRLGQASDAVNKVSNFYNSSAKIINAFSDTKLPVIGEQQREQPKDYFAKSKKEAELLLSRSKDLSMPEIEKELERIDTIQRIEKYTAGQTGNKGKQNSKKNKDDKDKK